MTTPRPRKALRKSQKWARRKILRLPAIILAWDMGAGKTAAVLTAIRDLLDEFDVTKVLVVAPKLVATTTWPDEIADWEHTRVLDYTVLRVADDDPEIAEADARAYRFARAYKLPPKLAKKYSGRAATQAKEAKRRRLADSDTPIHIINRDALPWLWEHFGEGKRWPYDMLVVDEASMLKNAKRRTATKGITRFGVMAKARKSADRVVLMTGTPAPKGVHNLWGLAYIADLGDRLGTSKHKFELRWFAKDYMGWNLEPRPGAVEEISERLSDIMFSMAPEDYAELPPMVNVPVRVDLPKKVLAEYRKFEKSKISEIYDVEAVSRGVLTNKLLQFANGSCYQEDGNDIWIHDEKLAALEEIVEDANGAPVLVAYSFKFDLDRIRKRFKKAVVLNEDPTAVARWKKGQIDMLLAHPASAGHGLNLQSGGNISVWYGLTHDLELYQQFNKRLHRSGQTKTVFNHHIIAKGTHDEDILPLLADKDATQSAILKAVQVRLGGNR